MYLILCTDFLLARRHSNDDGRAQTTLRRTPSFHLLLGTGRLRATLGEGKDSAAGGTANIQGDGHANGHLTERHTCLAWGHQGGRKVCVCVLCCSVGEERGEGEMI